VLAPSASPLCKPLRATPLQVLELLMPLVADIETSLEVVAMAALSLGLTFVGTCNEDISQALLSVLMERDQQVLQKETLTRLICLAIGLLYLGKQQEVEVALELAKVLEGPVGLHCTLTLETCAYAGTGNVLKVQRLLELSGEHLAKDEEDEADAAAAPAAAAGTPEAAAAAAAAAAPGGAGAAAAGGAGAAATPAVPGAAEVKEPKVAVLDHQSVAALGIAMVAMGEELGSEMSIRAYLHMLQYGDPPVRRAVPLALALLSASNPSNMIVTDTLSKLSHDQDQEVAINAIIGMGITAGGTNHSKVSGNLRSLATYYAKEPGVLFAVRLAQGLTHAGKGLVTLSPHHPDSSGGVCHPVALASLLVVMHICMDFKTIVLGKHHFLLWTLVGAMRPRMLVTVDEELKPLPVPVRVGQKVDVVGLAGRPKQITGFQTHTTPVLLAMGEKAELASDEYLPLSTLIEGVVILRKNPNHVPETKTEKKK
jgi:26S proteasome regulatory subunit N1